MGVSTMTTNSYPDLAKSEPERKDALVPDPQEYDMGNPDLEGEEDQAIEPILSAKDRLEVFNWLARPETAEKSN